MDDELKEFHIIRDTFNFSNYHKIEVIDNKCIGCCFMVNDFCTFGIADLTEADVLGCSDIHQNKFWIYKFSFKKLFKKL